MSIEIKVPTMGESISEAIVGSLLKPSGAYVHAEEEILELETDKVNQVVYAPHSGTLTLQVKTGDTVKIGQVLGTITPTEAAPPKKDTPAPLPPKPQPPPPQEGRFVRRPMSSLRKKLAERLVEAKNRAAMLTTFNEVDMTQVMQIRAQQKERLGLMPFFVKATVSALQAYPDLNSFIDGEEIVTYTSCDLGIAMATDKGLVVPVIRGCEQLSYADIEKAIDHLATKARQGKLSVDELRGGSFTITNGGVFGSLLSTPILNPPQSGILGMHTITKRAVVVDDAIVIRPMMYLALSYDHRIVDGKEAISFLLHIKQALEHPDPIT